MFINISHFLPLCSSQCGISKDLDRGSKTGLSRLLPRVPPRKSDKTRAHGDVGPKEVAMKNVVGLNGL